MTDALQRTTTAVTVVEGGVKENVLASVASALVNLRVMPGDKEEEIVGRIGVNLFQKEEKKRVWEIVLFFLGSDKRRQGGG